MKRRTFLASTFAAPVAAEAATRKPEYEPLPPDDVLEELTRPDPKPAPPAMEDDELPVIHVAYVKKMHLHSYENWKPSQFTTNHCARVTVNGREYMATDRTAARLGLDRRNCQRPSTNNRRR